MLSSLGLHLALPHSHKQLGGVEQHVRSLEQQLEQISHTLAAPFELESGKRQGNALKDYVDAKRCPAGLIPLTKVIDSAFGCGKGNPSAADLGIPGLAAWMADCMAVGWAETGLDSDWFAGATRPPHP